MTNRKSQNNFIKALALLLDASADIQSCVPYKSSGIGLKDYLKEYCTIQMKTSRRSGTSYAALFAAENFFTGGVIIGRDQTTLNNFRNSSRGYTLNKQINNYQFATIGSLSSLNGKDLNGKNAVIVDDASYVDINHRNNLYDTISNMVAASFSDPFFVVLVG